jgi:hypothetical protein
MMRNNSPLPPLGGFRYTGKAKPYGCKVVNNYYMGLYNWCSYSS